MKRGIIYILGSMALVLLAAAILPNCGRAIEARLQTEIDFALADKGLDDIEAHVDGQTVTLSYSKSAMKAADLDNAEALAPRMQKAVAVAESVRGEAYGHAHAGPVWGPVTHIRIDQPSINALVWQINNQNDEKATAVAQARACTEAVTGTLAGRKLAFVEGKAMLTLDSEAVLDDVYSVLRQCPDGLTLQIDAYTDSTGNDADNLTLSTLRAQATADGLIQRGLPPEMVKWAGFGGLMPIADNTTPEGQAANRRVTFSLSPQGEPDPPSLHPRRLAS